MSGRSPHGERGLKQSLIDPLTLLLVSLPTRGAWIETHFPQGTGTTWQRRSPHGERGLKLNGSVSQMISNLSLPTRGAWIETKKGAAKAAPEIRSLPTRGAWIETRPAFCPGD